MVLTEAADVVTKGHSNMVSVDVLSVKANEETERDGKRHER